MNEYIMMPAGIKPPFLRCVSEVAVCIVNMFVFK